MTRLGLIAKTGMALAAGFLVWRMGDYLATDANADSPSLVDAHVERVIDGDTIDITALVWIDQTVKAHLRIRGIDAPELHGHCPAERWAAQMATEWLRNAVEGHDVMLTEIGTDKFGRVLAHVTLGDRDIAASTSSTPSRALNAAEGNRLKM